MHGTHRRKSWLSEAFFHHRFELGNAEFAATFFAKPFNWSLKQLEQGHPEQAAYASRLGEVLYDLRTSRVFAPNFTKFTDRLIDSTKLTLPMQAGSMVIHRNPDEPADGVPLEAGESLIMSSANCPLTVVACDGEVFALHTGRDCLIDRQLVEHGIPAAGRIQHSVCFTALRALKERSRAQVKVFWAEPPSTRTLFDCIHGPHAEYNRKLRPYVMARWGARCVPGSYKSFHLLLPELIKAQCMEMGVPEGHINLSCAHQPPQGTWLDGTPGTPRNLVVLNRLS